MGANTISNAGFSEQNLENRNANTHASVPGQPNQVAPVVRQTPIMYNLAPMNVTSSIDVQVCQAHSSNMTPRNQLQQRPPLPFPLPVQREIQQSGYVPSDCEVVPRPTYSTPFSTQTSNMQNNSMQAINPAVQQLTGNLQAGVDQARHSTSVTQPGVSHHVNPQIVNTFSTASYQITMQSASGTSVDLRNAMQSSMTMQSPARQTSTLTQTNIAYFPESILNSRSLTMQPTSSNVRPTLEDVYLGNGAPAFRMLHPQPNREAMQNTMHASSSNLDQHPGRVEMVNRMNNAHTSNAQRCTKEETSKEDDPFPIRQLNPYPPPNPLDFNNNAHSSNTLMPLPPQAPEQGRVDFHPQAIHHHAPQNMALVPVNNNAGMLQVQTPNNHNQDLNCPQGADAEWSNETIEAKLSPDMSNEVLDRILANMICNILREMSSREQMSVIPCQVCEDTSSGMHYGQMTCEGCKGFFRRATSKDGKDPGFKCNNGGRCQINRNTRNRCQSCRYQKCLAVGMDKSKVKFGRMSKETRAILCQFIVLIKPPKICVPLIENIQTLYKEDAWILLLRLEVVRKEQEFKTYRLDGNQLGPSSVGCIPGFRPQLQIEQRSMQPTQDDFMRLNEVMNNIISASRNVGSDFESHVQGGSQMVASTSADRNPQNMIDLWPSVTHRMASGFEQSIRFARLVDIFRNLSMEDQKVLLQYGCFALFFVRLLRFTKRENQHEFFQSNIPALLQDILGNGVQQEMFELAQEITNLRLNNEGRDILAIAALFNADCSYLNDRERIHRECALLLHGLDTDLQLYDGRTLENASSLQQLRGVLNRLQSLSAVHHHQFTELIRRNPSLINGLPQFYSQLYSPETTGNRHEGSAATVSNYTSPDVSQHPRFAHQGFQSSPESSSSPPSNESNDASIPGCAPPRRSSNSSEMGSEAHLLSDSVLESFFIDEGSYGPISPPASIFVSESPVPDDDQAGESPGLNDLFSNHVFIEGSSGRPEFQQSVPGVQFNVDFSRTSDPIALQSSNVSHDVQTSQSIQLNHASAMNQFNPALVASDVVNSIASSGLAQGSSRGMQTVTYQSRITLGLLAPESRQLAQQVTETTENANSSVSQTHSASNRDFSKRLHSGP